MRNKCFNKGDLADRVRRACVTWPVFDFPKKKKKKEYWNPKKKIKKKVETQNKLFLQKIAWQLYKKQIYANKLY